MACKGKRQYTSIIRELHFVVVIFHRKVRVAIAELYSLGEGGAKHWGYLKFEKPTYKEIYFGFVNGKNCAGHCEH